MANYLKGYGDYLKGECLKSIQTLFYLISREPQDQDKTIS